MAMRLISKWQCIGKISSVVQELANLIHGGFGSDHLRLAV
jgi:hypothetical protein